MLLDTTCSFISKFFTEEEVQQIHSEAVDIPLDVGKVGMKETDPDGEETKGNLVNDTIRKSDIKWFTQEKPMSANLVEKIHQGVGLLLLQMDGKSGNTNISKTCNIQYISIDLIVPLEIFTLGIQMQGLNNMAIDKEN